MGTFRLARSRWAAIGAAVAVTLGGGGLIGVSAATSTDPATFTPVDPVRVLDTRSPLWTDADVKGARTHESTTILKVTGPIETLTNEIVTATPVPAGATAIQATLTLDGHQKYSNGYGFVTAYGCAAATDAPPNASTINMNDGGAVANSTVIPVDSSGNICLNVYGTTDLILDITGFYSKAVDAYSKTQIDEKLAEINNETMKRSPLLTAHSGASAVAANVKYSSGCTSGSTAGNGHQLWFYPQVVEKGIGTELAVCNNPVQGSTFKIPLDVMTSNGSGLDNASVNSLKQTYAPYQYTVCFNYADILEIDSIEIQAIDEDGNSFTVGRLLPLSDGCRTATFSKIDLGNMLDKMVSEPNAFGTIVLTNPVAWNLVITVKEDGDPALDREYHLFLNGAKVYCDSLEDLQEYVDS